ncbi:MAG TPA: hypothetical protein VGN76_14935 [Gemmatimonadales bacterium]|nr:hypothetical protein [Gemmatimonadales bacterium]
MRIEGRSASDLREFASVHRHRGVRAGQCGRQNSDGFSADVVRVQFSFTYAFSQSW